MNIAKRMKKLEAIKRKQLVTTSNGFSIHFFTSLHPFLVSICSSIHSCVHELMHAYLTFIHSFIRSFIHSFIHSFTHSILTPSFAGSLTHTLIRSFIHLIDHSVSLESVSQSATRVFHHTLWRRKNLFKIEISFVNSYCNSRLFPFLLRRRVCIVRVLN